MNDWLDAEHHVERAHEHYDAGRWDEAESELRHALSLNPYQAEWHFNLGLTLEAAGRYAAAADAFVESSKLQSDTSAPDANAMLLAGVNLIRVGRAERALKWLDQAEQLEPMNVAIVVHRIEALTELERFEQAEEAFYLGQQIDPEYPELYLAMGEALAQTEQHDRAVWCMREAARLDPTLPRVRAHLARAYARIGRHERARQLYLQELRVDPGDAETLLDLGDLLRDMHRYDEAGEKFRRVLELHPDHAEAHFALGDLAEMTGNISDALVHFDVVLRLDKDYPTVRTRLASTMLDRGRDEDMPRIRDLLSKEIRAVLTNNPSTGSASESELRAADTRLSDEELEDLGRTLISAGMLPQATRIYMNLLERTPASHKAWHGLSVSHLEAGQYDDGIAAAKRSLEYRPSFVPAMHNLVLAYYRQGQPIRARYWLKQAMRLDSDDPQLRRLRLRLRLRTISGVVRWSARKVKRIGRVLLAPVLRPVRS